jgi:hypothetical protein
MKPHYEIVRSRRRQNFFMIENAFIDDWAKVVGPISIAVYCCLWRHADGCNSTFIGTPKLSEKLKLSPRAMQRAIKTLADHKLICIVRTMKPVRQTVYQMLPVPSPAKDLSPMPLVDSTPGDCTVARVGGLATAQTRGADYTVAAPPPVLIEQDPFNKRGEHTGTMEIRSPESQTLRSPIDLENRNAKIPENSYQLARGMMEELGIPGGRPFLEACSDAISAKAKGSGMSLVAAYELILPKAHDAQNRGEFTKPIFWMRDAMYDHAPKRSNIAVPRPADFVSAGEQARREQQQRAVAVGQ